MTLHEMSKWHCCGWVIKLVGLVQHEDCGETGLLHVCTSLPT